METMFCCMDTEYKRFLNFSSLANFIRILKLEVANFRCAVVQEIVAISCSWCKTAYHTKIGCFTKDLIDERCTLGQHANLTVPPHWIIKLNKKVMPVVV